MELTLNGRSIALRELAETVPQLRCSLTEPGPPAPPTNPGPSWREPEWVVLGQQRAGSWWGPNQRGREPAQAAGEVWKRPVDFAAFPGRRGEGKRAAWFPGLSRPRSRALAGSPVSRVLASARTLP